MPKFLISELVDDSSNETWRLGSGTGSANWYKDTEVGKAVKQLGDSRMGLTTAGDPIEGFITSVDVSPADNYSTGGVMRGRRKAVLADGLQATPGTGTLAVGDYVVAGTMVAKDTSLGTSLQKVCKATQQPNATYADLAAALAAMKNALQPWKVVSLGTAGTGAVGTVVIIERGSRA